MNSIIGFSIQGKTYYFLNIFSNEQLHMIKQFVDNFRMSNPTIFEEDDHTIIEHFMHDANELLECDLHLLNVDAIFIIK